jgi:hypothetical protein
MAACEERLFQQSDLGAFAAAVNSLDGNELSGRSHVRKPV